MADITFSSVSVKDSAEVDQTIQQYSDPNHSNYLGPLVAILNKDGTIFNGAVTVSGVSTAAKQPALGTAGVPSADIITVQGAVDMYPVVVASSGGTFDVTGSTVTANPNNITMASGSAIAWKSSGGDYALTCTSVTNGNGRQGAKGDLGATRAESYDALLTFSVGSAATNGTQIELYWASSPSATAGTSNPGGTSGTDATFNTTPDEYKLQLQFIGSMVLSNNASTGVQTQWIGPFVPKHRYGMPVVYNKSGQTLGSTAGDHTVTLYPRQRAI